jgi:hypothetical protein
MRRPMNLQPKNPARRVCGLGAPHNPFSLACHAAGTLAFVFTEGQSGPEHLQKLATLGGHAQILGGEGTGKTTLLRHLSLVARATTDVLEIRADRTDPTEVLRQLGLIGSVLPVLLCLDEADAWSRWELRRVLRACRTRRVRLLAATHRDLGLPTLHRCLVDDALAVRVAAELLAAAPASDRLLTPELAREALRSRGGNLREALLLLYDWHEDAWAAATVSGAVATGGTVGIGGGAGIGAWSLLAAHRPFPEPHRWGFVNLRVIARSRPTAAVALPQVRGSRQSAASPCASNRPAKPPTLA